VGLVGEVMIRDYAKEPKVGVIVPRQPRFAIILVASTLALTTVLIIALISLKPDHKVEEHIVVQVDPISPIETPEPLTPVLTKKTTTPDFTYSIILKQTEVKPAHVKVYESTAKDPTKKTDHVLQVASFKSERDAKELQKRLIKKKLTNVQVTQSTTESGTVWYRVMVGPFQNRSMLNKAQDTLVQMNFSPLERKQK
jgi:cell division protein FtsN